ncbi:MAG: polysaccharide biosynthesis tyrosine autokinase [Brachybacterium sp.]|nr:polysaccharide biosynthesis tyrosine autokinase [Brachybacterium sp.]MDN5686075.1 polysaccharide biosynthesis tyrosine autokinase [Brachybacterium sp.]
MLDEVIAEVGLDTNPASLARDLTVSVTEGSFLIEITATATDPELAAAIANSIAANLREGVASLAAGSAAPSVELRVVSPAVVPTAPSSPDVLRNAILGIMLALLAGIGTALVRSMLNTRVRSIEDLQSRTDRIVLGTIPASRGSEHAARVLIEKPYGAAAESYRELRTNLQFVKLAEGRRSVLVTSSLAGEGKSTCSVNLAQVLARSGTRVLLVDADLRSPSVHGILGLEGDAGLTTVLIGHAVLPDVLQSGGTDGLDVITSGAIPPNPSELLGSSAMEDVLREAARHYDVVIVDVPPVLAVTDAAVLSRVVGGVVVVAQNERVRLAEFERSMAKLQAVGANIVGTVLNRARGVSGSRYAYAIPEQMPDEPLDVTVPASVPRSTAEAVPASESQLLVGTRPEVAVAAFATSGTSDDLATSGDEGDDSAGEERELEQAGDRHGSQ